MCEQVATERAQSLAEALASLRAEGLVVSAEIQAITERWVHGEISTSQMRELVRRLYGVEGEG